MERLNTHVEGAFGIQIRVGNIVAYPGRQGSSMWMNCGVVTGITMKQNYWNNKEFPVLLITRAKKRYNWKTEKYELLCRKTFTSRLDRVVPVDVNQLHLPEEEQEALLSVYYDTMAKLGSVLFEQETNPA